MHSPITRQWRITKRSNAIILNMIMGMLFYLVLRTSNDTCISALQKNNNFNSFNFLMGDNSVDLIPPAFDNGEPNSTMANQIVYSPKETILEGYFCTQMVPSWVIDNIVLICFCALHSLSTANAISERSIIPN